MSVAIPFVHRESPEAEAVWLNALRAALPEIEICSLDVLTASQRADVEVAIVADPDPAELATLPNLKWIHSLWAGVERLVTELPDDGVGIVRLIDPQMSASMSEAVLAWTLYLHRDMPRYRSQQTEKRWLSHSLPLPGERTVGILGLGTLGRACAARLQSNGFNVCGWNRTDRPMEGVETFSGPNGLLPMLEQADILVVLLPLTDATRGLVNAERLAAMPQGASVINFARGPIIDDDALLAHLSSGHLDHAVLDVFDVEPLPKDNPFWNHPKVTVLPHISGPTNKATASAIVARNIRAFLADGTIPQSVDRTTGY